MFYIEIKKIRILIFNFVGEASLEEGELSEEELEMKRKALLRELQQNSWTNLFPSFSVGLLFFPMTF